jgi:hypothetical protein
MPISQNSSVNSCQETIFGSRLVIGIQMGLKEIQYGIEHAVSLGSTNERRPFLLTWRPVVEANSNEIGLRQRVFIIFPFDPRVLTGTFVPGGDTA